ncbi:MAG: hypothetical protein PWQ79_363 [Thermococcaceae archaeon]|nr:hypothetical protein [Thermococcaceae archaeon]MDK2913448.1 hypothetical protein [Thermococcaceae archaeon]
MPKRVKMGHHYYYVVSPEELGSGGFRGKNIVMEGFVEDKPQIEFYPSDIPSWRTIFRVNGISVRFVGAPCLGEGDRVKVYGRFVGDCIMATVLETERAIFTTEE